MKISSGIFLIFYLVSCISSCVYLIPFIAPKPEEFKLYKENKIGIIGLSEVKGNGGYYFCNEDNQITKGKKYTGYYRFKSNGELHIEENIPKDNPDSAYHFMKSTIDLDIDKTLYGYYSATGINIKMEYVREIREKLVSIFYESTGVLSKNGDTLFVKEHRVLKNGKIETLNRTCIYYPFQK
ncbi:MAG: hypothetical protein KBB37_13875 [Bacteroidia bacterium]|nr:hypothetical protein [Bacteroidia bacterium]MBP7262369.1 hypothetical protein [Bacteroidia bacterium]MBP9181452.1 hypothetical protein [Bacteroidia bacterium]